MMSMLGGTLAIATDAGATASTTAAAAARLAGGGFRPFSSARAVGFAAG